MPYYEERDLRLHYTDHGDKHAEAVITLHGLSESHLYWTLPGITDHLVVAGFRVIGTDMRAHGLSRVTSDDKGYDIDTLKEDINRLASHLGIDRFHLLGHATGAIVALRYAMDYSDRLFSLVVTDAGSATLPTDECAQLIDPEVQFDKIDPVSVDNIKELIEAFRGKAWEEIFSGIRAVAGDHMFFNSMHKAVNPESAFAMYEACARLSDPELMANFIASFYNDPDPKISGLRSILCPVLMTLGENDILFIKPAEQVAREVPDCKHVVHKGMGHMLAFENPQLLGGQLVEFLREIQISSS